MLGIFAFFVPRCPIYNGADARCTMVPDTNDACCKVPSCPAGITPPQGIYAVPKVRYSYFNGSTKSYKF